MKINSISNFIESIVYFDNCNTIIVDLTNINNVTSNYSSAFMVLNSKGLKISNFFFNNITTENNSGGCLYLQAKISGSLFEIQSGSFTLCSSRNAKGGAIFLDSISRISLVSLQMLDLEISNCLSEEGSAIFISNNIAFIKKGKESELKRLIIKNNISKSGGTISDYHYSGNIKIDNLEMLNNNYGIYASFSNKNIKLSISNTKIHASATYNSVIYFNNLFSGSLIYLQNIEIYNAKLLAIEAFNVKITIYNMNILDSLQAFYLYNNVEAEIEGLKIIANIEKAIVISKNSSLYCNNCEFKKNFGSIIEASTNCSFTFENSQIFSNTLNSGFLLYIFFGDNKESILINCEITSNLLNTGNLIYLSSSALTLRNCIVIDNEATKTIIKVIYSQSSILNIFNSKLQFKSNITNGALLYAEAESIVDIKNTTFENSLTSVSNIYGSDVKMKINNCTFSNITGQSIFTEQSKLSIINCVFGNSVLSNSNSGIVALKNNLQAVIKGSRFFNVSIMMNLTSIAYIYDELSSQLEISNCSVIGSENFIMALFAKQTTSLLINSSNFTDFKTNAYSALTVVSDVKGCELSIISSRISENLSTKSGGGVYSDSYNLEIENTEISFNNAEDSGGGIYFQSPNCDSCGFFLLGKTRIFENWCSNDGGAIKWKDYKPFIEPEVSIFNNSARYGANFASVPASFGLSQGRKLSDSTIAILSDVAPGKKYTDVIQIYIYDTYNQIVKTENSITVVLTVNETVDSISAVSGITSFKSNNGVINITDFILTGEPGSSAYLKLKSDNMKSEDVRNDYNNYSDSAFIKVEFRNCTKGEQIQASACINCDRGKYTLQASKNCLDCPNGATCSGGDIVIPQNGYWRSSLESDIIYTCDVFDACLKGSETNQLGNCSRGYSGVLCKSCEIGYSKTASGICTKCPNQSTNFATLAILILSIISISFILVKTTLKSAFSPKSLHSIYIKIFTNYLQLVFIVTQFDLEWPYYVTEFFNIQKSTSSISDQLFSFDCYIANQNSDDIENTYYIKLCMISALPITVFAISFVYWIFHSGIKESYSFLKREVYTTIIVLFFLLYPTIVRSMFANFSCIEIDKMKSYLNENTSIECWDSDHRKYSIIVAIPSIIIWVVGFPTLLLVLMTKNRRRLHLDYYRVVYGFLYNGYKQSRFYWEIKIMYRKILLISILVFKISQAHVLQALNLIIVLLISIYLHHSYRPYNSNHLNSMEMQALNIAAITTYFGLYYLSNKIGEGIKILLFIFIVVGNSFFILNWVYYMARALIDVFIKYFPQFRTFFKRGDAFEDEFNTEEITRKGVYFNPIEGEKAFTFINLKNQPEEEFFMYKTIEEAFIDVAKRDIERLNSIRK